MKQNKIYVGNLSYDSTKEDLQEFFAQYGELAEVKLISDYDGRSKGFAFITFAEQADAQEAVSKANGASLQGRTLKVNMAREEGKGGGGAGGAGGRRSGGGGGRGGHGGGGGYGGGRDDRRW